MAKRKKRQGLVPGDAINIAGLLVAFIGFVYPFYAQPPGAFVENMRSMAASAGATLSVGVTENPYNSTAQQLTVKQLSLQEREAALDAREAKLNRLSLGDMFSVASFALSLVLCGLIGLNFYLDMKRGRRSLLPGRFQVDLR